MHHRPVYPQEQVKFGENKSLDKKTNSSHVLFAKQVFFTGVRLRAYHYKTAEFKETREFGILVQLSLIIDSLFNQRIVGGS